MKWILLFVSLLVTPALAQVEPRPTLGAPVFLDGENLGEVWVFLGNGVEVDAPKLIEALSGSLTALARSELISGLSGQRRVPLSRLEDFGILLKFDESALILRAELRDDARVRKSLRVRRGMHEEREAVGPEAFSGYINATANQGFAYPRSQARQPFRGNLFFANNIHGLVLETGATYLEGRSYEWTRDDTRLVKDFEKQLVRVAAGDINTIGTGYQNSRLLGGLSLTRQYSIQPYLNIRPLNRTEIHLRRPSMIEIYVNKAFVNRVNAMPGPVQLSDFPLFTGVNQVDLKITDDTGRVEWINLNFLYDAQLLGEGLHQFAYQAGAPAEPFRGDRRYDNENITGSFFHRAGLTDTFTLGGSFQFDRNVWLAGNDFILLTRGGLFSLDSALARRSEGLASGAGRVRYRSLDYKLGGDRPIRGIAEIEYRAKPFGTIGQLNPLNEFSWRYDLSLSRPISAVTSIGAGAQYQVNRVGGNDRKSVRTDFIHEFAPQWRASFGYSAERENRLEHRFQVSLTWLEEKGRYFGNMSYNYPSKTVRVEGSRNPSSLVDDYRATVGVQNSPSSTQGDFLFDYTHEKMNVRLEHTSAGLREPSGNRSAHATAVTGSTAVAWAGGSIGWTRPIGDSFVLLESKPMFKKFPIPVNQIGPSAEATVNRFGPGVVPTLTSYNETPVILNPSSVPLGYSIGKEYFLTRPTYRSGVKLLVGGDSSAVFSGRLLRPGGAPLALVTGEVVSTSGERQISFFTNREGVYVLENLPPGNYLLQVDDASLEPLPFSVSENQAGFIKLEPKEMRGTE